MSLNLIQGKFMTKPNLIKVDPEMLSFENDEAVPKRLRESLKSPSTMLNEENEDIQKKFEDFIVDESGDHEKTEVFDDLEENFESQISEQISSETEIIFTSSQNTSSTSLVRQVSSMSMFMSSEFERSAFLTITRIVPLRSRSAIIIYWSVKSILGIIGYEVHLDGQFSSAVHSVERTSAVIKGVNLNMQHRFSVNVILEKGNFSLNFRQYRPSATNPAVYCYSPE